LIDALSLLRGFRLPPLLPPDAIAAADCRR